MYDLHGTECNFVHHRIIGAAGGLLTGGFAGAASGFLGGGRTTNGQRESSGPCPPGEVLNEFNRCQGAGPASTYTGSGRGTGLGAPRTTAGQRKDPGVRGFVARVLPGGDPGVVEYGEAVMGAFGVPALEPAIVGEVMRNDGQMSLIRRCPRGTVLATDNLCYNKGVKGLREHRKWKPAPKGFLPAKDVRCLRRAISIKKSKTNKAMLRELGLG